MHTIRTHVCIVDIILDVFINSFTDRFEYRFEHRFEGSNWAKFDHENLRRYTERLNTRFNTAWLLYIDQPGTYIAQ